MKIQAAKDYLLSVMSDRFTDKTFERYITHHLAGDFAVEIANTIKGLDAEVERLTAENANLKENLTLFRYAHGEIEAACGGEVALDVRGKVMDRRARIEAEAVQP